MCPGPSELPIGWACPNGLPGGIPNCGPPKLLLKLLGAPKAGPELLGLKFSRKNIFCGQKSRYKKKSNIPITWAFQMAVHYCWASQKEVLQHQLAHCTARCQHFVVVESREHQVVARDQVWSCQRALAMPCTVAYWIPAVRGLGRRSEVPASPDWRWEIGSCWAALRPPGSLQIMTDLSKPRAGRTKNCDLPCPLPFQLLPDSSKLSGGPAGTPRRVKPGRSMKVNNFSKINLESSKSNHKLW